LWTGNTWTVSPETNCDLDKSDQIARDWFKESQRAHHKGGLPGSLDATCAAGHGTRSAIATATTWSAATASDTTASRHHPAGVVTVRDLTVRDCTVDAEPTMVVRCVGGVMAQALTLAIDPARHRQRHDGISRRG
jgi:hypothetical protein